MADPQTPRSDDAPNAERDTDGRGAANRGGVADPNVEAVTDAFEGRGNEERGPDTIDLQDMNGGTRREPGR